MKDKGFTLIELMIVIVIIGIVAGIAIPRFIDYKNQSKVKTYVEVKKEVKKEVQKPIANLSKSGIECVGGKQVIRIGERTYWIANEPDTWGDLKTLPCE